jgi:acetyltransferase-like isoleucine patch superfamily enzyme
VRVLDGTVIGRGCVVAAGAVVRGVLEPGGIYAGVPARLLRMRTATTT